MRLRVHQPGDAVDAHAYACDSKSMMSKAEEAAQQTAHKTSELGQSGVHKLDEAGTAAKHRMDETATSAKNIGK